MLPNRSATEPDMTACHASGLRERLRPLPYGHSTVSDQTVMGASAAALSCGWGYAADRLRPEGADPGPI